MSDLDELLDDVATHFQDVASSGTVEPQDVMTSTEQGDLLVWTPQGHIEYVSMRLLKTGKTSKANRTFVVEPAIEETIVRISVNQTASYLLLHGRHTIHVVQLPNNMHQGAFLNQTQAGNVLCSSWKVADWDSTSKSVVQVEWHPLSDVHVAVLFSDGFMRLYNLQEDADHAEQTFNLCLRLDDDGQYKQMAGGAATGGLAQALASRDTHSVVVKPRCFSFRSLDTQGQGMELLTLHVLMADCSLWALCPVLPHDTYLPLQVATQLLADAQAVQAKDELKWLAEVGISQTSIDEVQLQAQGNPADAWLQTHAPTTFIHRKLALQGPLYSPNDASSSSSSSSTSSSPLADAVPSHMCILNASPTLLCCSYVQGLVAYFLCVSPIVGKWHTRSRLDRDGLSSSSSSSSAAATADDSLASVGSVSHNDFDTAACVLFELLKLDSALPRPGQGAADDEEQAMTTLELYPSMRLQIDSWTPTLMYCAHRRGLHAIEMPWITDLQAFVDSFAADDDNDGESTPAALTKRATASHLVESQEPLLGVAIVADTLAGYFLTVLSAEPALRCIEVWTKLSRLALERTELNHHKLNQDLELVGQLDHHKEFLEKRLDSLYPEYAQDMAALPQNSRSVPLFATQGSGVDYDDKDAFLSPEYLDYFKRVCMLFEEEYFKRILTIHVELNERLDVLQVMYQLHSKSMLEVRERLQKAVEVRDRIQRNLDVVTQMQALLTEKADALLEMAANVAPLSRAEERWNAQVQKVKQHMEALEAKKVELRQKLAKVPKLDTVAPSLSVKQLADLETQLIANDELIGKTSNKLTQLVNQVGNVNTNTNSAGFME